MSALAGWLASVSLQQDFAAYYTAGAAVLRGLDPYVNHVAQPDGPWDGIAVFRHSRFLYPPLLARLFAPLSALPYSWAKTIFTGVGVATLFLALALVERDDDVVIRSAGAGDLGARGRMRLRRWAPLGWALWPPTLLVLERGQIDLLLLGLLVAAWRWRMRHWLAGFLLACAGMTKPMVFCVLPLLIASRRYRWAAATIGGALALLVLNLAVAGRGPTERYLREVLPRAALYGEGGPEAQLATEVELARAGDDLTDGVARIDGVGRTGRGRVYEQQIGDFPRNASLARWLARDGVPSRWGSALIFLVAAVALARGARRTPDNAVWYWGGLVAAVLAAPVAWAMELVWALPLLHLATARASGRGARGGWVIGSAFAAGWLGPVLAAGWLLAGVAAVAAAVMALVKQDEAPTSTHRATRWPGQGGTA